MLASTQTLPSQIMLLRQGPHVLVIAFAAKYLCLPWREERRLKDTQDQNGGDSILRAVSEKENQEIVWNNQSSRY